jgi:hypothetical protein
MIKNIYDKYIDILTNEKNKKGNESDIKICSICNNYLFEDAKNINVMVSHFKNKTDYSFYDKPYEEIFICNTCFESNEYQNVILKEENDNNFNNIENNLNLNNVIERGNLNHLIFEQNNHYDEEDNPDYDDMRGESEDFEEEEEFIDEFNDDYNEQIMENENHYPLFIDEYSQDDYNSYSSSEEIEEEMFSISFLRMEAECDFSMRFSDNLKYNYNDM